MKLNLELGVLIKRLRSSRRCVIFENKCLRTDRPLPLGNSEGTRKMAAIFARQFRDFRGMCCVVIAKREAR